MITQYIALLSAQALGQADDVVNLDELKKAHDISAEDLASVANYGHTKKVKEALWLSSKGIVNNVVTSNVRIRELYASVGSSNEDYNDEDYSLGKKVKSSQCHTNCHYNCHGSRGWR